MSMPATSTKTTKLATSLIDEYALLGWRAMLTEVNLSPKPGLVDRINCGAHKDMALEDFHRSALAIQGLVTPVSLNLVPVVQKWHRKRYSTDYAQLVWLCEGDMFRATAGVNTHKGSIFSLGLLCAAIGRLLQLNQPVTPTTVCSTAASFCRGLTDRELRTNNSRLTAGQRLYQQLGLTGARGEAEAGYPLVINHALPHYLTLLDQGLDPELALLDTCSSTDGYQRRYQRCIARWRGGPALATARGANIIAKRGHSNPRRSRLSPAVRRGVYRTKSQSGRRCRPADPYGF